MLYFKILLWYHWHGALLYWDVTKIPLKYYFLGTIVVLLEYHWCTAGIHEHCRGNTTVGVGVIQYRGT